MNIQSEKLDLMRWIAGITDESILQQFISLKNLSNQETHLTEEQKKFVDLAFKDIEQGRIYTYEQVMQQVNEEFPQLFNKK